MKKYIIAGVILSLSTFSSAIAAFDTAPDFLAKKGVIAAHYDDVAEYKLSDKITRREMLKVMMNLSGKTVAETCEGVFKDMPKSDWGCKYAEGALKAGYIAKNTNFRPNDNVSQIEALKMIMQAKDIEKDVEDDWRKGYVSKAKKENLISDDIDYDAHAIRSFIFIVAAKTYSDAPTYIGDTSKSKASSSYDGLNFPSDVDKELEIILNSLIDAAIEK